jgi:hypothetical protein
VRTSKHTDAFGAVRRTTVAHIREVRSGGASRRTDDEADAGRGK